MIVQGYPGLRTNDPWIWHFARRQMHRDLEGHIGAPLGLFRELPFERRSPPVSNVTFHHFGLGGFLCTGRHPLSVPDPPIAIGHLAHPRLFAWETPPYFVTRSFLAKAVEGLESRGKDVLASDAVVLANQDKSRIHAHLACPLARTPNIVCDPARPVSGLGAFS